jgi:hypothetical protein
MFAHVCKCTSIVRSTYDVLVLHDLSNLLDDTLDLSNLLDDMLDSGWNIEKIMSLVSFNIYFQKNSLL